MVKQMERRFSLRKICHVPSVILYFAIAGQMAIGLVAANEVNLSQPEEKKTIKIGVVRLEDPYFYLDISTASALRWNFSEKNIKTGKF